MSIEPTKARTTFRLGKTSRIVLAYSDVQSHRLEFVCEVYRAACKAALPRFRRDEWIWLLSSIAGLDVRSMEHLTLIVDRVRHPTTPAKGIDTLGLATRLQSAGVAGRAAIWDLVLEAGERTSDPALLGEWIDATLPNESLLR